MDTQHDGARASARPFDEMPTITLPESYVAEMPDLLARMAQEHGPVFRAQIGEQAQGRFGRYLVFMVGPDANRFVMHTRREAFSHDLGWTPTLGGVFEQGLLNTDDPEHARDRKMMNPAFAIAYMSRYLPIMNRVIAERTRDWAERGEVDVYQEARKITFDVAAECLVGFSTGPDTDRLRDLFYQILHATVDVETEEEFYAAVGTAQTELTAMLLAKIAERRAAPTDDILGVLAQARDDEGRPFTDQQLLGQLHILLVAGHETSTTLAAWLLYYLAAHPDYRARVEAELDEVLARHDGQVTLDAVREMHVLGRAVDETGRLRSPVGNVPRGLVEDVEFGGYRIPTGTRVLLSLAACHRLPDLFASPDVWDPDRFAPPREEDKRQPYSLVPFGGGPRICIGINFAQVEIKALAAHVLRRFVLTPVADGWDPLHVYFSPVATLLNGMQLRVAERAVAAREGHSS